MPDGTMDFTWVEDTATLEAWVQRLVAEPRVALDTESNSMHAYFERICLVQISTPHVDLLIDALAVDLRALDPLLVAESTQKVMHGADYDVLSFKRSHGVGLRSLFDTGIAARVLGWPHCGLAAILDERLGVSVDKRFQRYDWGQRPLSVEALNYACSDTHHLLAIQAMAEEELQASGRADLFHHACERQTKVEPRPRTFDPDGFWRIKGAELLKGRGLAALRRLYGYRDQLGRALDRPVYRVVADPVLVVLARKRPKTIAELEAIRGVPKPLLARHAEELLEVLRAAASDDVPKRPPRGSSIPKAVVRRYDRLRMWRRGEAQRVGTEPDIVLGKRELLAVAQANPRSESDLAETGALDDWERARYGTGILSVLANEP